MSGEIVTERLRMRPFRPGDLPALTEIFVQRAVWKFPFRRGLSAQETEQFLEGRIERQALPGTSPGAAEERSSGTLIGYIHLTPPDWLPEVMPAVEIGWRLDPRWWGRGLATEGARAVMAHGFTVMELPEILSIYEPENAASGKVMERIGMRRGHDTRHPFFDVPLRVYRLTREEWAARSKPE